MLKRISRGIPLGAVFIAIASILAVDSSPGATGCFWMHCFLAVLLIAFLRQTGRSGNIVIVAHMFVVFTFSLFCAYILAYIDVVAPEANFEFNVFTSGAVKRALLLNDYAIGVSLLVYGAHSSLRQPSRLFSSSGIDQAAQGVESLSVSYSLGMVISWGVIAVLVLTPSIFQAPYPENMFLRGRLPATVRVMLALVPFGFLFLRFAQDRYLITWTGLLFRVTTYCAIFAGLLGGARGGLVGLLIGLLVIDISYCRNAAHLKWLSVSVSAFAILFAILNWPFIRVSVYASGFFSALWGSFENYSFVFSVRSSIDRVYLSDFPMLGQSLFHFLYTIALVDSGNSLHYQSFFNLLPQQLPVALDGILWTRPLNDNWLLGDYFRHGGGFYSYANAYWNGGPVALGLFAGVIAWAIARVEILFKALPAYYAAAYFMLLILVPVGFYYGIQGLVRGIEYSLLACLGIRFASKWFQLSAARRVGR